MSSLPRKLSGSIAMTILEHFIIQGTPQKTKTRKDQKMTRNNLDDIIISEIADDEHGEQAPVYPTLEQVQQAIEDAILDLGMEGRFADQEKRFDVKLGNVRQAMPKTDVPANVETMIKKSQQAVKARIKWVAIGLTMVIGVISW